jgi:pyridoxamine 5'-phosphate oxidase
MGELRDMLRELPSLTGSAPPWDPGSAPAEPGELFVGWLREAASAGVPEPQAMTLSTVDRDGRPDARVLILKDLDAAGWWFASDSTSAKGRQLWQRPAAALTFYWPPVGRQVRVRGLVTVAPPDRSAADFLARGDAARAAALASPQSRPLGSQSEFADAVEAATERLRADPGLVSPTWTAYVLRPDEVQFWQSDERRRHVRLHYTRTPTGWARGLLWP